MEDGKTLIREPLALYGKTRFTEDEYIEFERNSLEWHEYYKGEIFEMPIPDKEHAIIQRNLFGQLFKHLEGKRCQPFNQALRIHIRKNTLYTYPDISIVCYNIMEEDIEDEKDFFLEPTVIVEILSPFTRNYDQGDKFRLYKDIPRFEEYVLIDSTSIMALVHLKNEQGLWVSKESRNADGALTISKIGLTLPFTQLYKGTNLIKDLGIHQPA